MWYPYKGLIIYLVDREVTRGLEPFCGFPDEHLALASSCVTTHGIPCDPR